MPSQSTTPQVEAALITETRVGMHLVGTMCVGRNVLNCQARGYQNYVERGDSDSNPNKASWKRPKVCIKDLAKENAGFRLHSMISLLAFFAN